MLLPESFPSFSNSFFAASSLKSFSYDHFVPLGPAIPLKVTAFRRLSPPLDCLLQSSEKIPER